MRGITKEFGPVRVLHGIDLDLRAGEVHALLGENGAGKSTLMKILGGYHPPTSGSIRIGGDDVRFPDSGSAEARGVVLIHQEFNLAEHLTVEENIFLGREITRGPFLDRREMRRRSRAILAELETELDTRRAVNTLSVSQKQMVEIAKAVSRNARVLIMDEPTAVLTKSETEILFRLIERLRATGVAIVYISHKLDEVERISDRVTVLRDGQHIATRPTDDVSQDEMAALMVGRDLRGLYPERHDSSDAEIVLEVRDLTVPGWVQGASFDLRRGEVLGFAGLVGAGRTELIEGMLGLRPRSSGEIRVRGRVTRIRNLQDAVGHRIAYLSEDRKGKGIITSMPLRPNLTLLSLDAFARPFLDTRAEGEALERAAKEFDIRAPHLGARADQLSGGNQQKLVLAKIMLSDPEIVILDEPTRGIDIGTKQQIYRFIDALVRDGKSVILISSEMQEIVGLSHRVVVMRSGIVTGVLEGAQIGESEINRYQMGLKGAA